MPKQDTEQAPVHIPALKEEVILWLLSAMGAVVLWAILTFVLTSLYHPDMAEVNRSAQAVLIDSAHLRPEPVESLLFRLSVILVVPTAILLYKGLSGKSIIRRLSQTLAFPVLTWGSVAALALLIYGGMAAVNPYGPKGGDSPQNTRDLVSDTNFQFYFKSLFTGEYLWAYLLIILPLIAVLFFIGMRQKRIDDNRTYKLTINTIGYTTAAFLIITIVAMNSIHFPYTDENKFDFSAVYYAATQVFSGKPMLVNGFIDTYGMYPHFLLPLFRITGLSVTTFSATMSVLLGLAFIMNLFMMRRLIRNTTLFFLGFFTLVFFPYLDFKLLTVFDCIFSLYPIRYIIPSSIGLLALLYFTRPTRIRYYTTFFVSALFILWNPEIGLSCYMAWTLANVYASFFDAQGRPAIRRMVMHIVTAIAVFIMIILGHKLFIYLGYGVWPDSGLLFKPITYYTKYGMSLLPMSLLHPWNISAIILLLGFIYAGAAWHHRRITPKSTMVMFLSLVGIGYFTYFQGRSQNSNYALSSGFSLIVLTILADELWDKIKDQKVAPLYGLFVIALGCLSFSFAEIVYNAPQIVALSDQDAAKQAQAPLQQRVQANTAFIENTSAEGEKIIVFTAKKLQPLFFNGNKRRSAFDPGYIDLFLRSDLDRFRNIIIDSAAKVYLEPRSRLYDFMAPHITAVAATCEYVTSNASMVMLQRRRSPLPATTFFTGSDLLFHRKYTDDRKSIEQRISDAAGIQTMAFPGSFSISTLFYSATQFADRPVIVGNIEDSSGFIITCNTEQNEYLFGVNGSAISVVFPRNTWCYTVMNISSTAIELFVNGRYMGGRLIPTPIRTPRQKMAIGNLGDSHNFTGAIAEVAIAQGNIDSATIKSIWNSMRPQLETRQ
ncbi:hypothetical protein GCM10023093_23290 [Nemorincola caseinilytica]|uniref:LamG domain-containing protein n=1 Tax=Nemorincola caseinilytica TaxID=2054315 RepID=A0ABP8NHK2_9BACT